jgi:hypothetical protein
MTASSEDSRLTTFSPSRRVSQPSGDLKRCELGHTPLHFASAASLANEPPDPTVI